VTITSSPPTPGAIRASFSHSPEFDRLKSAIRQAMLEAEPASLWYEFVEQIDAGYDHDELTVYERNHLLSMGRLWWDGGRESLNGECGD